MAEPSNVAVIKPVMRRGLNREQAAAYVGVSPGTFDAMIAEGLMPPPKRYRTRTIWDVQALDLAFEALPGDEKDTWADYRGEP